MSCEHDCTRTPEFPAKIGNRPGLARIDYRIGSYSQVRAHLLAGLDASPELSAFTHRHPDDPAIALLEADAIVVDILSFYQRVYANESYLRTAQWPESIGDLVRLTGYRLAPGVAGEASFALTIKGARAVEVPPAFGLKAQIEGSDAPVEFETLHGLSAVPALSAFRLYRPRQTPSIGAGTRELCISAGPVDIKADDRLVIGEAVPSSGTAGRLVAPELHTVEAVWESFGRQHLRLRAPIARTVPATALRAYRVGETLRHFGHAAPASISTVTAQGYPSVRATSFLRQLNTTTSTDVAPSIAASQFPLDREFSGIQAGDTVLVQGRFIPSTSTTGFGARHTLFRKVGDAESQTLAWGMLTGASRVLGLGGSLGFHADGQNHTTADVRSLSLLQVTSAPFTVQAAPRPTLATSGATLHYFGGIDDARALEGRRLLLRNDDGTVSDIAVHAVALSDAAPAAWHTLTLSTPVTYADFGEDAPRTWVHGNVVDARQGKTQAPVAIGSGDARLEHQSLALPKAPLTYRLDPSRSPGHAPELEVRVDGMLWKQVDTLFNAGPLDRMYIVREDAQGDSIVQFGDGRAGARPATGRNNIVASYRVGIGASGMLKPDTTPQATGKLKELDKVLMPLPVTTGTGPESAENARAAAPARLQSLGRLVSLADYEAEARSLPNVLKASARWGAPEGVPAIVLTVLTPSGAPAELAAIRAAMDTINRCRGPVRHRFHVRHGHLRFVHLQATVAFDPAYLVEAVTAGVRSALGVMTGGEPAAGGDGLFSLAARDFHQSVHASQAIAAIQNVPGVSWVRLLAAQVLAGAVPMDPLLLPVPAPAPPQPLLACPTDALLALHERHLQLGFTSADSNTECR